MALDVTGIGAVADLATTVVNKIWPDKSEEERAQLAAAVQLVQGQLEINKVEAASASTFVAGWRPFIGWTCGVAFAYKFVLAPVAALALTVAGHPITLPALDFGEMMPILFGMLGLGAMRSFEKVKGVAK
ncbi:holin family protein [Variovorax sp. GT1P44]|uniref:holin family protein n=1 Tax=Variovorax sp. GT1P44 TaxID=3443742 RepID=UPI003F45933F